MNAPVSERVRIINLMNESYHADLRRDVLIGMTSPQKFLPSKYFYDGCGSRFFEQICCLPEYYQTRTELAILKNSACELIAKSSFRNIIELGAGSNLKISTLLDAHFASSGDGICYIPVDVSEAALIDSCTGLIQRYPGLTVTGIISDFTKHMGKISFADKKLFTFLGSTIGNFTAEESRELLKRIAGVMGPDDTFIIGIDMIKGADLLEKAYNDSQGVTAEFNKNILTVINRELNACFDKGLFDHVAFYNPEKEQVEMHLRANRGMEVRIGDLGIEVSMERGETVRTEICRKFSRASFSSLAADSGFGVNRWFSDADEIFSVVELVRA